jgi:hypothetical protein
MSEPTDLTEAEQAIHVAICEGSPEDCKAWRGRCVKAAEAVRPVIAAEALTAARRDISDYRIGLGRNRTHVDARFQGRLRGLEEAAGQLTALIKSLRANEPGIEAPDEH